MINFSVVIVTYGREVELSDLMRSISDQNNLSNLNEIIVVDNHPSEIAKKIINQHNSLNIKYINNKVNSLTSGRSKGANATNSDIVLFLDDDVILECDYFDNLIKFYTRYPDANGMQGIFDVGDYSRIKNFFNRLFWLFNYSHSSFKVYPSIQASYACNTTEIKKCEWFSGTNFSYKKNILLKTHFDLKLKKYCVGEEIDYSYRVFKNFGGLYVNPHCKIKHQAAITSREIGKEFAIMQEIYGIYLLKKLFPGSKIAIFKYFISRVGKGILLMIELLRFRSHSFINLVNYFKALHRSYFDGDIEKFNKEIM